MKVFSNIIRLRDFLHKIDIKLTYFIILILFSLAAALFEGISAALLVPLTKGVIEMDFSFLKDTAVFKTILNILSYLFVISNSTIFILLVSAIFIAIVLKNILQYAAFVGVARQLRKFSHNMRKMIFDRYMSFGKLFFDRNSDGYLHNLLMDLTNTVTYRITEIHGVLGNFFMLIVYIILMFIISWKLSIFMIILSPIFYYSLRWLIEKIKTTSKSYTFARGNLSKKIYNILPCVPLVKAYTNEEEEKKEFANISESIAKLEFSIDKKLHLMNPLQEILMFIVILLLVSVVAFIVVKGKHDLSGFLVYFYIIKRATGAFAVLNKFKGDLATISGPMSEILKVFDDKDKFFITEGKQEFKGLQKCIEFKHLDFSYLEEKQVLKDISLSIEKGKITAIVGPTGVGKTTLINLILRFYECPPSAIFIDGSDIKEFTLKSLRAHIGLVSQEILLFNDTLRNNIIYGLDGRILDEKLIEVTKKARLYDFIINLPDKFDTYIGDRGVKLSGGEKQRVAIARALLKGSEILILDEATSSLDSETEKLIQAAINEAVKGRTTIVIAHRFSTIKNADKIIVIEEGRLIEQGTLEELLKKRDRFYRYWEEQKFY